MNFAHDLNELSVITFWIVFAVGVCLGLIMRGWVFADSKPKSEASNQSTTTAPEKRT